MMLYDVTIFDKHNIETQRLTEVSDWFLERLPYSLGKEEVAMVYLLPNELFPHAVVTAARSVAAA